MFLARWYLSVALIILFLSFLPPVGASEPATPSPVPGWKYSAAWMRQSMPNRIVVTKDTVVLYTEYDAKHIVAVDRASGKERWRRDVARLSDRSPGIAEEWGHLFPADKNLVIAQIAQVNKVTDSNARLGYRTEYLHVFLRGIDARTGRTRWEIAAERQPRASDASVTHFRLPDLGLLSNKNELISAEEDRGYLFPSPLRLLGVYGGKIAVVAVGKKLVRIDAVTGRLMSPNEKKDQSTSRLATGVNGSDYALVNPPAWSLLHLRTGEIAATEGGVEAVYVTGRIVCRIDTDNDAPGGSLFPKWLEAYDLQGKSVWKFPETVTYRDRDGIFASPESTVTFLDALPKVGVVLTGTDAFPGLIALHAQDGMLLWKKRLSFEQIEPSGKGFFMLMTLDSEKTPQSSFAFVYGESGHVQWLVHLPVSHYFKIEGNDLFLLGWDNVLRAYIGVMRSPRFPHR